MEGFGAHTDWNDFLRRLQAQRDRDALREMERRLRIVAIIHKKRDLLLGDFLLPRPDAESTLPQSPEAKPMSPLTPMLVLSAKADGGTQDTKGFFAPPEIEECFVLAMNQILWNRAAVRTVVRVEFYNPGGKPGLFGQQPRARSPKLIEHATGVDAIREERDRQLAKGFHEEHDEQYRRSELAVSAAWLLAQYAGGTYHVPGGVECGLLECARAAHLKHAKSTIRRLSIAGAFIAAEIDRLERKIRLNRV